jgi:hypothetical protein
MLWPRDAVPDDYSFDFSQQSYCTAWGLKDRYGFFGFSGPSIEATHMLTGEKVTVFLNEEGQ